LLERVLPSALVLLLASALAALAALTTLDLPRESASIMIDGLAAALGLACAVLLAAGLITAEGAAGLAVRHSKTGSVDGW